VLPDQTRDTTDFWRPDLPGRRGFDLAHRALNSRVEPVVADFTSVDLSELGTFDIVLYLGVLYHMKEPLTCLERLRTVTVDVAVIETVAAQVPGNVGRSLLELHAGGDLNADFGNWYVPTIEALSAAAVASGFTRVDVKRGPPPVRARSRIARRLHLVPSTRPNPAAANYRAVIQARP
jgi:tRNA (mo5U34)-methyltransferase